MTSTLSPAYTAPAPASERQVILLRDALPNPLVAVVFNLAGLIAIAGSWVEASGKVRLSDQLAWLNLGIGGLVLMLAGNAAYLTTFRRAVRRRISAVNLGRAAGSL